MISGRNRRIINAIKKQPDSYDTLNDLFGMARAVYEEDNTELPYCFKITSYIKKMIPLLPSSNDLNELYWNVLLWEAPNLFESFLLYMEKNRSARKKFYEPRSNTLKIVVDDLQDLEDGVIEFYGLSLPPRVGKSTICIFFGLQRRRQEHAPHSTGLPQAPVSSPHRQIRMPSWPHCRQSGHRTERIRLRCRR